MMGVRPTEKLIVNFTTIGAKKIASALNKLFLMYDWVKGA